MRKTQFKKVLSLILCAVLIAAMALTMTGCGDNDTENPEVSFNFTVTDKDGKSTEFLIKTDKETVGEALLDQKLIEGEQGDYGIYVKKVNGITADYDTDGTYWAFYIDGEMSLTGADQTRIKDGGNYEFRVEKG